MILFIVGAVGGIIWILILMLFGDISKQLYDSLAVEAKVKLNYICELEAAEFAKNGRYSADMEAIGFYQGEDDGSRFTYEIGLADSLGFVARAFAIKDYDQDQQQLIYQVEQDCKIVLIQKD